LIGTDAFSHIYLKLIVRARARAPPEKAETMLEQLEESKATRTLLESRRRIRSATNFPMPAGLVMTERATAALRAELVRRGSGEWIILYNTQHELYDLENHLVELGETASWEPLAGLAGGEAIDSLTLSDSGAKRWPAGILYLEKCAVALARWYWADVDDGKRRSLYLVAAESTGHYQKLRKPLAELRRKTAEPVWQVIHGGYDEAEEIPRALHGPDILLEASLRLRIETDALKFFSAEVMALYRSLGVPHRRGILMYGPPGNGKTSLIRQIGAMLPEIPALVLRGSANFDTDDLEAVIKRWTDLAPAILVIEDLDWLLQEVNVSTFLNSLDGISTTAQGLLLIATTNHPETLDPAINNRPGRFDLMVELPNPDRNMREQFFASRLPDLPGAAALVADLSDRLSFSHLQEVLRLSGLLAINAGRTVRLIDDLNEAVEKVQRANRSAQRGFPTELDVPFGLQRRRAGSNR
jgi:hypothetical protein